MKRILVVLSAVLFSAISINAQNKQVESNLLFSRGSFFETGSNSQRYLFNGSSDYPIPFIGTSFRVAYGLDIPLKGNWSLMPGASLRAHTACLIGMFGVGGDIDTHACADAFCSLRYHIDAGKIGIVLGLGPDVSWSPAKNSYYIDADPRDPRNGHPKFKHFGYSLQPSITFQAGKHWQWGLEALVGLRNMRVQYDNLEYWEDGTCLVWVSDVKGSTYFHMIALTWGFRF